MRTQNIGFYGTIRKTSTAKISLKLLNHQVNSHFLCYIVKMTFALHSSR